MEANNMAAMREALERCRNTLLGVRDLTTNPDIRNGVANCLAEYVEPALSAPPRNCDRFATLPDALAAWRDADPREAGPFDLWLFAPATELEGGVK
jgi:hypothetical protein